MKLPHIFVVSLCLLGATQLLQSQVKETTAHGIPGTLDPATGKFTTRVASQASAHPEATSTPTNILFRETFNISITNYDQSATTAVCSVELDGADSADQGYEEQASVSATASQGTFSCSVPVLAQWALSTPTSDTIYAYITVTLYTPGSQTGQYGVPTVYRSSVRNLTLSQPGNTQSIVNNVSFVL